MAAHKKGQAYAGPYTDSKDITTPHPDYDDEGNHKRDGGSKYGGSPGNDLEPEDNMGDVDRASAKAKRRVQEVAGWDGLSSVAPKK
jgi:hypothetical protein